MVCLARAHSNFTAHHAQRNLFEWLLPNQRWNLYIQILLDDSDDPSRSPPISPRCQRLKEVCARKISVSENAPDSLAVLRPLELRPLSLSPTPRPTQWTSLLSSRRTPRSSSSAILLTTRLRALGR